MPVQELSKERNATSAVSLWRGTKLQEPQRRPQKPSPLVEHHAYCTSPQKAKIPLQRIDDWRKIAAVLSQHTAVAT
jgi:hypothetical protein